MSRQSAQLAAERAVGGWDELAETSMKSLRSKGVWQGMTMCSGSLVPRHTGSDGVLRLGSQDRGCVMGRR